MDEKYIKVSEMRHSLYDRVVGTWVRVFENSNLFGGRSPLAWKVLSHPGLQDPINEMLLKGNHRKEHNLEYRGEKYIVRDISEIK